MNLKSLNIMQNAHRPQGKRQRERNQLIRDLLIGGSKMQKRPYGRRRKILSRIVKNWNRLNRGKYSSGTMVHL